MARVLGGIIPARAGFTQQPAGTGHPQGDHPRSRGVYVFASGSAKKCPGSSPLARGLLCLVQHACQPGGGSSPLARGLPVPGHAGERGVRIIPARAGFTTAGASHPHRRPDHPRSRGVYRVEHSEVRSGCGSSPLARGLHGDSETTQKGPGIIPARAGFTDTPRTTGSRE